MDLNGLNFDQLVDLWWENLGNEDYQKIILKKMSELADTFNQWKLVWTRAWDLRECGIELIAFYKAGELAETREEILAHHIMSYDPLVPSGQNSAA